MTKYYIENSDIEIAGSVSGSQVEIKVIDTLYTDVATTHAASSPLLLHHSDVIEDIEDPDGSCTLSFQHTSVDGWTLTFQRRSGSNWSAGQSTLTVTESECEVEWRVQAKKGGTTIHSDPFIRVFKGQPTGGPD
ncbi:MAG: hypothetical protein AAGF11_41950 [Myxococcota bacterium]